MYCSTCGGAVASALTYCNHCGTKLAVSQDDRSIQYSAKVDETLVWSQVGVLSVGLGGIIGLLAVMKEVVHFEMVWIIAFTIVSFALVIGVEGFLISQLLQRGRRAKIKEVKDPPGPATKELKQDLPRMLPEPTPSVTEHTTRTFEPVYSERKAK